MDGVTRESIKPLLELQRVDSSIDRLVARRANLPEQQELDELTARRAEVAATHAERGPVLSDLVGRQARLETEIGQISDRHVSEEKRLMSGEVQSPRELSNIQAELDALRRRKTHLEDQELEIMEEREGVEGEVASLEATLAELDVSIANATARRDAATAKIDAELEDLRAQHAAVAGGLPEDLVGFYGELRGKHGGIAVGAYEDGTCRACSLPLSPAQKDEIKRSDDPMIRCENCRRLLVIP